MSAGFVVYVTALTTLTSISESGHKTLPTQLTGVTLHEASVAVQFGLSIQKHSPEEAHAIRQDISEILPVIGLDYFTSLSLKCFVSGGGFIVVDNKRRETGLPIPRCVSLKADRARMRIGPAFEYAIKWLYRAPRLPLEITEEYGNWRQVRDCDGISGWMHRSLLSSDRTAVVGPWLTDLTSLRARAEENGSMKAKLEARVRVRILSCSQSWCDIAVDSGHLNGFVEKSAFWGVYPQEVFD